LEKQAQTVQGLKAPPTATDVLNYLLKTGIDYKGQVNYAFQQLGYGASAGVSVDVLSLGLTAVGFGYLPLTGTVSPNLSFKAARERLVIIEYQNDRILDSPNATPVCLEEMQGVTGTLHLSLGIEAGPSFSPTKHIPGLEQFAFGLSVSATAQVSGSYEGTYVRIWDPQPRYYTRSERWGRLRADAYAVLSGSAPRRSQLDPSAPHCSFTAWTQSGEADASVGAKASFSMSGALSLIGKNVTASGKGSASASVKGPSLQRSWKWSSYRLQTLAANGIVMTQDVELTYKKLTTQLLEIDADAGVSGKAEVKPVSTPASKSFKHRFGKDTTKTRLNALGYRAALLYWRHAGRTRSALDGSGFQIGHSVSLQSLVTLLDGSMNDEDTNNFMTALAGALKVNPDWLGVFLSESSDTIASLALDTGAQPSALLIEANFRARGVNLNWTPRNDAEAIHPPHLLRSFAESSLTLETLRLRYRMKDDVSSDRAFKLGISLPIVDLSIELDRLSDCGSEGVVDLHVTEFGGRTVQPTILIA
jgi:hypothetical protein